MLLISNAVNDWMSLRDDCRVADSSGPSADRLPVSMSLRSTLESFSNICSSMPIVTPHWGWRWLMIVSCCCLHLLLFSIDLHLVNVIYCMAFTHAANVLCRSVARLSVNSRMNFLCTCRHMILWEYTYLYYNSLNYSVAHQWSYIMPGVFGHLFICEPVLPYNLLYQVRGVKLSLYQYVKKLDMYALDVRIAVSYACSA